MFDKKFEILSCSIDQDQVTVAKQWANTFVYNSKDDLAVNMTQLLLACVACGNFGIRPYLSKSSELQAPSEQLNIVDYLSHASRIILDYQELTGSNREELLKYFPEPGENNIFSRSATHNVRRGGEGEVLEGKGFLLGVMGQLPGIIKTPLDFGINIAMGGEGQENFYGKKISANGYSGHFYFHHNSSDRLLMLGLEQSAPSASPLEFVWGTKKYSEEVQQNHDQFGQGHSLTGASDTYTAAGSLYFSDPIYQTKLLLEKGIFPPDKYGAMQVRITDENWPHVKQFLAKLSALSDEEHKKQLLELLLTKPVTATSAKSEYLSYIALDFDSYLKRVYQTFISGSVLDVESRETFLELQSHLLATIKKLQQGHIESYELFKQQIANIIEIKNIPPAYQQAIIRIQQLFELQLKIDSKLNETHQELLLKNQYDDLQEESKIILEKLLRIQKYFQEQPPIEEQRELRGFLKQIDMQIKELQSPFASPFKEVVDLSTSWVMCEPPVSITMDSIDQLRQTIERAKLLTKPNTLKSMGGISFPQLISGWEEKLLPLSQINLIDYTELNLSDLAKQFNQYVDVLAEQAETLNLWEHHPSQTTNILVDYSKQSPEIALGHAFVAQYRESTILRRLMTLDPSNLGTLRFKPYEDPAAEFRKHQPHAYWSKVNTLLTAGSDLIAMLRTLKNQQMMNASWEEMSQTATLFQNTVERFKKANENLTIHLSKASQEAPVEVFESPFFYPISDEILQKMNGVQLATVCLEELNAKTPSALVKRITNNPELWKRMDTALQTEKEDFKRRKDDVEKKITALRQIRQFWELEGQFKENTILETKEQLLVELQRVSTESSAIFGAPEAIKEAQMEFTQLREFLLLLQNIETEEEKYTALQLLEQKYQKLPENEQKQYLAQLNQAKVFVYQVYFEKINASQTIESKRANFHILNQLFEKLPCDVQKRFEIGHEVTQKEESLYKLYDFVEKTTSVNIKQFVLDGTNFSTAIEDFENLNDTLTSECAKKVHKQLIRLRVIYTKLLESEVIKPGNCIDALLKQLEPMLDDIDNDLQSKLIAAMLQDQIFAQAILKGIHKKPSSALIQDLVTIKMFRDQKIELSKKEGFDREYNQSMERFYEKALNIRLSDVPLQKQAQDILDAAKTEFSHRHDTRRLIADVIMLISILGLAVGVVRWGSGRTFFFSDAKTDREVELKDHWLSNELPEEGTEARILTAPAA